MKKGHSIKQTRFFPPNDPSKYNFGGSKQQFGSLFDRVSVCFTYISWVHITEWPSGDEDRLLQSSASGLVV